MEVLLPSNRSQMWVADCIRRERTFVQSIFLFLIFFSPLFSFFLFFGHRFFFSLIPAPSDGQQDLQARGIKTSTACFGRGFKDKILPRERKTFFSMATIFTFF